MDGPQVTEPDWVERYGVLAVERAALAARAIWRETPLRDVGIDGQLEYVLRDGVATGRLVAVQVKSGPSYWTRGDEDVVLVTPPEKHRSYWARHPLPVILVLHDEDRQQTIWTDARAQLRDGQTSIRVPRSQILDADGVRRALAADGPLPERRVSPAQTLREMVTTRHPNPGFCLSFFDLFAGGMTDIAHSLYFGMDLVTETQDVLAALPGGSGQISIGSAEFDFLDRYVAYLLARDLARVNFDAWRRMLERFGMVGTWISPLTQAGEDLIAFIHAEHSDLLHAGLVRERFIRIDLTDVDNRVRLQQELARRLANEQPVED
jgi:hypothetical protein